MIPILLMIPIAAASTQRTTAPVPTTAPAPATAPASEASPGPHAVLQADAVWRDEARRRDVPVRVYAPDANTARGLLPAVVISHGLGGSREGYAYLGRYLAGYGYICVVPTHMGSDTSLLRAGGTAGLLTGLADANNLVLRPGDISFVIDRLLSPEGGAPADAGAIVLVKGRVDANRIGVAGHSFGAYTALAVAGQTIRGSDGNQRSFRDERVKAAVAMSSQGPGRIGLTEKSWDAIRIPVLTMTGTLDYSLGSLMDLKGRRAAFDHMPPGDKYHMTIDGAAHHAFSDNARDPADLTRFLTRDPRHHPWILAATRTFFDAYLKGDQPAREWLRKGAIEKDSAGHAKWERRPAE